MSEHEEARALDQFHDRFAHQRMPDWLRDEAKVSGKDGSYNLGHHTAEFSEQGTLVIGGAGAFMALSAEEAYNLLIWLDTHHRDTLNRLLQQHHDQEG
jgi:hypothetical protein